VPYKGGYKNVRNWAWEHIARRKINSKQTAISTCDNELCVNPQHCKLISLGQHKTQVNFRKIEEEDHQDIFDRYVAGKQAAQLARASTYRALGKEYGVTGECIRLIVNKVRAEQ
jgi:hypothetical protein